MSARIVLLPLVAALALVAAGCGKSSKPETTADWASSFCSSVTTWNNSVQSAAAPLKSGTITKDSIQTAFNDFKSATDTFVSSIKGLGKPPTQAGDQAKQDVDALSSQIDNDVQSIKNSVKGITDLTTALAAATSVSSTLSSMSSSVKQTFTELQQLDPKGELTTAIQNADSCKTLKASTNSS